MVSELLTEKPARVVRYSSHILNTGKEILPKMAFNVAAAIATTSTKENLSVCVVLENAVTAVRLRLINEDIFAIPTTTNACAVIETTFRSLPITSFPSVKVALVILITSNHCVEIVMPKRAIESSTTVICNAGLIWLFLTRMIVPTSLG